jgi:hypothetical protein
MEAARNNSCVITSVGYQGNSVYRVVASIPIWVTVTSLVIWVTCGRFPWKAPTTAFGTYHGASVIRSRAFD